VKYLPTDLASLRILSTLLLSNVQTAFCHILVSNFVLTLSSHTGWAFDGSLSLISFLTVTFHNWTLTVVL